MCFFEGKKKKEEEVRIQSRCLSEWLFFSLVNFVNFLNLNLQPQSQEFWVPALRRRHSAVSFSIRNKRGSSLDNLSSWDKDAVCGSALDNRSRSDSLWRRRLTLTLWLISFSGLISLLILSLKRLSVLTCIFFFPASSLEPDSRFPASRFQLCIIKKHNIEPSITASYPKQHSVLAVLA